MTHVTALKFINKNFSEVHYFDDSIGGKDGIEGYYSIENDNLYIFFNPTDHRNDWNHNFFFFKKSIPYPNMNPFIRVHSGFVNLYKDRGVRNKMHSLVEANASKIKKVIVSGFSLGAAIATLCILDLQYHFPKFEYESYTFGSPRVGNFLFALSYNRRVPNTWRYVYGRDIVTMVPLIRMFFFHVKNKFKLGKFSLKLFSFKDHYLRNYKKNISELI